MGVGPVLTGNRMPQRKFPPLLLFLGILLLLGLALYSPVLLGGKALYFRDIYHNYYTQLQFMKSALWQGELPFWNPQLFAGTPQMAVLEPPLFYPPGWIFFTALPFQFALVFNLLFHLLLAGLGIYLLGQRFGWSLSTRLLAALLFCFSGLMASLHSFHPLQNTVAWLPLVWWAFQACLQAKALQKPQQKPQHKPPFLWLSLFYGLQILSGHLEIVYFESALLLVYGLWLQCRDALDAKAADDSLASGTLLQSCLALGRCLAALGLGVGLSALQLLPALAFLPHTVRSEGLGEMSMIWSYHPFLSLLLFLPDYLNQTVKGLSLHQFWGDPVYAKMPFFISGYLGLFPLLLLFTGLSLLKMLQQRALLLFFSLLALFLLLLAWGKHFPLYSLLLALPGMGFFRYPSKLLVFVSFGLSLAAAIVFQALKDQPPLARRLAAIAGVSALLLACGFLLLPALSSQLSSPHIRQSSQILALLRYQGLFATVLALAFGLVYYLQGHQGKWLKTKGQNLDPLLQGLLLGGIALDLLFTGWAAMPLAPSPAVFESPSKPAQYLLEKDLQGNSQARMLVSAAHQVPVPPTFAPQWENWPELRFNAFHHASLQNNFNLAWGFRNAYGEWAALGQKGFVMNSLYLNALDMHKPEFKQVYESLLGVRYVLSLTPDAKTTEYYSRSGHYLKRQEYPEMQLVLWENKAALPRARFHYQSMAIKDPQVIPALLAEPLSKSGIDFRSRVLLNDDQALKQAKAQVPAFEAREKRWQGPQFKLDKNNHLELALETNTSGYLVLADQHLPGWRAWDNGQETPILTAHYFMRAIRVGPGKHQITMKYEPPGFVMGLWVTLLSGLIWLGLLAWGIVSQRRSPSPIL